MAQVDQSLSVNTSRPSETYSVQTFIISLAERTDRRESVCLQLKEHDYSTFRFWDAVKGSDSSVMVGGLSDGELGLWLSTLEVIDKHIISESSDALHIAEDDCTFSRDFFSAYPGIVEYLVRKDIDIVFTDGWARGELLEAILAQSEESAIKILPGEFYGGRTTSYIISPRSLRRVRSTLKHGFEMMRTGRMVCEPIDSYYRRSHAQGSLKVAICAPFITGVSQDALISRSNISVTRRAEEHRWEQLHTLTSQLAYKEYDSARGSYLLASALRDLDKEHLAQLLNKIIPWLASKGYIEKARQKRQ